MNEDLKTTLKPAFDLLTESAIKYYKKHQYYGIHPDTVFTFVNCTGFLGRYLEFTLKALEGEKKYHAKVTLIVVKENDYYLKNSVFVVVNKHRDLIPIRDLVDIAEEQEQKLGQSLLEILDSSTLNEELRDIADAYAVEMDKKLHHIGYDIDEASTKLDPYPKSREQI